MQDQHYKGLIYFISCTVAITIAIQVYWNIQNYNTNKQRLMNEVQISLDNSVERYFSDLAKTDIFSFSTKTNRVSDSTKLWTKITADSSFITIKKNHIQLSKGYQDLHNIIDSSTTVTTLKPNQISAVSIFNNNSVPDSLKSLTGLANKIVLSITKDTLDFQKLSSLLQEELQRKDVAVKYVFKHFDSDSTIRTFKTAADEELALGTFSKSTYLPKNQKLELRYSNPTAIILKRSAIGLLLSFFLSACIIGCMYYLFHTIKKQKELAEIKNDLISNITHEFKTPIATVATAIEGIKNFNANNDKEKTSTYLNISEQQLKKLHLMVEKLLETATLDQDKLLLHKEKIDLFPLVSALVSKYQAITPEKSISFKANVDRLHANIDTFHFENVLANLVDNAIKYGGNTIVIHLNSILESIEIMVVDDGNSIEKNQHEKVFDQFYRVPTGNKHDVKGFGIGLFYAKKIVEKHGGTLVLVPDVKNTIFKITL
ncbi:HAMP domain-containing sensor histidine kinase [uncultured Croceitalea sp.]|uniref:sensor histidine kinase n=1 Tax=uncultured Croceitalea sp. TaxID=1798908 RepID=UPI00330667DC